MKKCFSEEQIIGFLPEPEAGIPLKERCRKHDFSEASYYLWRSKFGGMKVSEAKRLKELGLQLRASRTRTHTSNRSTATCGRIPVSEDDT